MKKIFCVFQTFLNSPQNSEYFEYRHIGWKKKPPQEGQNKNFGALGADPFPRNLKLEKDGFKNFGGRGGGLEFEQAAALELWGLGPQ